MSTSQAENQTNFPPKKLSKTRTWMHRTKSKQWFRFLDSFCVWAGFWSNLRGPVPIQACLSRCFYNTLWDVTRKAFCLFTHSSLLVNQFLWYCGGIIKLWLSSRSPQPRLLTHILILFSKNATFLWFFRYRIYICWRKSCILSTSNRNLQRKSISKISTLIF